MWFIYIYDVYDLTKKKNALDINCIWRPSFPQNKSKYIPGTGTCFSFWCTKMVKMVNIVNRLLKMKKKVLSLTLVHYYQIAIWTRA